MPRTFRRLVVPLAVAALGTVTLTAAPAGAASSAAQVAQAGTIVASDLGAGWTAGPSDSSGDKVIKKLAAKTKGCEDYAAVRASLDTATDAASPEFETAVQQISNHSYVYKTEAAAAKALKRASAGTVADCFTDLFTKVFAQQINANPATAKQVKNYRVKIAEVPDLTDALGDQSVGYAGGAEINGTDGTTTRLILSTLVVRVGPAVITYSYSFDADKSQPSSAFDAAVANTIARTEIALA